MFGRGPKGYGPSQPRVARVIMPGEVDRQSAKYKRFAEIKSELSLYRVPRSNLRARKDTPSFCMYEAIFSFPTSRSSVRIE